MKKNKAKWISRALSLYTLFSRRLQKRKILNAGMEFERIAIYSTTALGDLMFNTPAIHALKLRYPNAAFVLVSSEKNRPLVETSPWFDDVLYWDNKIRNAHRLISSLRRFKPQLTVILHSYMPYDILCAVLSGSEYIMRDRYRVDSPVMDHWVNANSASSGQHLIQRKLELVSILGCRTDDPAMHIPVAYQASSAPDDKIRIGFQMGASEASRCWPVARFVELAAMLSQDAHYQVVLTGGHKDKKLVEQFAQLSGEALFSRVDNRVGKTSLTELITLIDSLDVLVTGDTGPLHLAIALKTPTVSLFAEADPTHTGPYQDMIQHAVLRLEDMHHDSAQPLGKIEAQKVKDEVLRLVTR